MNAYTHEIGCDARHTLRQVCNARAAARLDEYRRGPDHLIAPATQFTPTVTASTSAATQLMANDAEPVMSATTALVSDRASSTNDNSTPPPPADEPASPVRAVADGPVEPIDVTRVPRWPLIMLAAVVLLCLLVLVRLVAGHRRA